MALGVTQHVPYMISCLILATTSAQAFFVLICWSGIETCRKRERDLGAIPVNEWLALASAGLAWLQVLWYCVCVDCIGPRMDDIRFSWNRKHDQELRTPLLADNPDPVKLAGTRERFSSAEDNLSRLSVSSDPDGRERFVSTDSGGGEDAEPPSRAPSHWLQKYKIEKANYAPPMLPLPLGEREKLVDFLKKEGQKQVENSLKLQGGWRIHSKPRVVTDGPRVAKLLNYNNRCTLWSVQGHIPGVTPDKIQDICSYTQLEMKNTWDKECKECEVVELCEESHLHGNDPTYWYESYLAQGSYLGGLVTARDFSSMNVLWTETPSTLSGTPESGLQLMIASCHNPHPACPEYADKIRGEIQLSCIRAEPSHLISGSVMTFILGIDIKISAMLRGAVENGILKEASELLKKVEKVAKNLPV